MGKQGLSVKTVRNVHGVVHESLERAVKTEFHDLRHSYAVLSLLTGANLKTLSSQLGHATVAFTLDVYGHTTDSMRKDAADRMCTYIQSVTGDEK